MSTTPLNTLLLDQSAWDLVLDINGNIALAAPPYALAQDVASAIRTFLGEVWYDTTQGIPYWTQVLGKLPPSSLLIAMINAEAEARVQGLVQCQTFITGYSDREITGYVEFTDTNNQTGTVNF